MDLTPEDEIFESIDGIFRRTHTEYECANAPIFGEFVNEENSAFAHEKYITDEQAHKQLKDVERGYRIKEFSEF